MANRIDVAASPSDFDRVTDRAFDGFTTKAYENSGASTRYSDKENTRKFVGMLSVNLSRRGKPTNAAK
ncbi:hypothetical protein [Cohnella mopanensis]|uniref:hypothetical protein n=1 Tax=Cohnella mopanensis TaxID=2911966 RepID=UPI001EF8411B|nr:hypothetical protein [Cohnella mopanensis]